MAQIASTEPPTALLTAADGAPLRVALARAERRARRRAFLLVAAAAALRGGRPSSLPIGQLLYRSVWNPGFSDNMPAVSAPGSRRTRPGPSPTRPPSRRSPPISSAASEAKTAGIVGTRINYDVPGTRSLFTSAARAGRRPRRRPFREAMLELDEDWADPELWAAMRAASSAHTPNFYVAALDRKLDATARSCACPRTSASTCRCSGGRCSSRR